MMAILGQHIREADFQRQVLELAALYRWLPYHTLMSRGSHAGFPDLVLVRGSDLIFAELKAERGRVSRAQAQWLGALENVAAALRALAAGVTAQHPQPVPRLDVYVWRPSDFDSINARLAPPRRIAA